jgi:hypothetical protein
MASNGRCAEEVVNHFKATGIGRLLAHKLLRKILDPEYCTREVKRLKVRVR